MDDLIKQAFQQVDVLGPQVQAGHFDLIGANSEIILPAVWEKVVQPGWSITMTMWPQDRVQPVLRPMPGAVPGIRPGHRGSGIQFGMPGAGVGRPPGLGPGGITPPPGWMPSANVRHPGPPGVNIVNVGPESRPKNPSKKPKNTAILGFFAGKSNTKRR